MVCTEMMANAQTLLLFFGEMGKQLLWEDTDVDALAASRLDQGSLCNAQTIATETEARKLEMYCELIDNRRFFLQPVAMELQGFLDESIQILIMRLCKKFRRSHDDQRAGSVLTQWISLALQIANAACVPRTVSGRDAFEEIYYILSCQLGLTFFIATRRPAWVVFFPLFCFCPSTVVVVGMNGNCSSGPTLLGLKSFGLIRLVLASFGVKSLFFKRVAEFIEINVLSWSAMLTGPQCPKLRSEVKWRDEPYGQSSMLPLGEGSEATELYNKHAEYFVTFFVCCHWFLNKSLEIYFVFFVDTDLLL